MKDPSCVQFALCLYFLSYLKANETLFVFQDEKNYFCFKNNSCEASMQEPLGSLLEALELASSSPKWSRIIIMNDNYNFTQTEIFQYMAVYSRTNTTFELKSGQIPTLFQESHQGIRIKK